MYNAVILYRQGYKIYQVQYSNKETAGIRYFSYIAVMRSKQGYKIFQV
jgi:hypothetical protein